MRARTTTIAIMIGVATAGVMALGAQTAAADVVKYDTKLTITKDRGFIYHGLLGSEVRKCERGRWVVLFKQRLGADRKLGTDRTGAPRPGGKRTSWGWIEARRVPGVYAKVRPKVGDGFVCRADRAPNTGTCHGYTCELDKSRVLNTLAVAASQAHGDGQRVKSEVTVEHLESGHFAHGRVRADKNACRRHREVKLYTRRPDADWRLLFTTTTKRAGWPYAPGYWSKSIDVRLPVKYFAVVTRERKGGYLCTRDKSPVGRESRG
jgi:hypothetical protein